MFIHQTGDAFRDGDLLMHFTRSRSLHTTHQRDAAAESESCAGLAGAELRPARGDWMERVDELERNIQIIQESRSKNWGRMRIYTNIMTEQL